MSLLQNQFNQSAIKGQLDMRMNLNTIPCAVKDDESTPLVPGQAVKIVDSAGGVPKVTAVTETTDAVFGTVAYNMKNSSFAAGESVEIAAQGNVIYLEAGAAIARGARVMAQVTGSKVVTVTGSNSVIGIALDKATGNESLIRVFMTNFVEEANFSSAAFQADIGGTLTGSTDGDMEDVADIALSTGDSYSDAAVNGAVNTAIAGANLQLKELQVAHNALLAKLIAAGLMDAS